MFMLLTACKGTNKRAENQKILEFSRVEVPSRHCLKGTNKRAENQENFLILFKEDFTEKIK